MNIGILTFHNADSYGAVLQAYALQQKLKTLGADSTFVTIEMGAKSPFSESIQSPNSPLIKRIHANGQVRKSQFDAFRRENLNCALPCPYAEAQKLNEQYDCFIAGSDQIWNFHIPDTNESYFLPFAKPHKRYAYAASFGADEISERLKPWYAKQLAEFQNISVREPQGVNIVSQLTGKDVIVCLDPTLLLTREEWEKITLSPDQEEYVLLFILQYDAVLVEAARKKAIELHLPLKVVTAAYIPQLGFDAWSSVGVKEWVTLVRHAHCVFTNSYHGTIFSLLFGRPFSINSLSGELGKRNGRTEALLAKFDMQACADGTIMQLSYEALRKALQTEYEQSIDYLKGVINSGKSIC